jgi:hypothetical protein
MDHLENGARGDRAWSWIVIVGSFGVFVYATTFRGSEPSFGIAFLAIAAAVLPTSELRRVIRRWKDGGDSNG